MERDKEREMELESATYTSCLLLGLDPSVIGIGVLNGIPRVGLFRHSNPKLADQLLHYLISSIRGPSQSAKDFDGVWPICDAGQSKDFRKVVLGVLSELEEQGAIPKCSARVSALANCCGIRFVDLLWQLSVHALREVHCRTFVTDVASNPLPSILTVQETSHASSLLPVMKARIGLQRRKFMNNVESAVIRQAKWLLLAHELTAEFRNLCAEEAYLQLELEKMQDMINEEQQQEDTSADAPTCSSQSSQMAEKATDVWDSILSHTNLYELLSSGPVEDLIAHREHRFRISGSSLLAAMDQSSQDPAQGVLSAHNLELGVKSKDEHHTVIDWGIHKELYSPLSPSMKDRKLFKKNSRNKRLFPVVDIAEVFRRWTQALESIQRQSYLMANANNGEGPDLLRRSYNRSQSEHTTFLYATQADHEQHLSNFEVFTHHLTELNLEIQKSVRQYTEQVHTVTTTLYPLARSSCGSVSPMQANNTEIRDTEAIEASPKSSLRNPPIDPLTVKLPELFNLTSTTAAKGIDDFSVQKLKRSVREAAMARQPRIVGSRGSQSDCGSDPMFTPHSTPRYPKLALEHRSVEMKSRHSFETQFTNSLLEKQDGDELLFDVVQDFKDFNEIDNPTYEASSSLKSFSIMEDPLGNVFSPTLLADSPSLDDFYEDLLAPLSETETAMMEH